MLSKSHPSIQAFLSFPLQAHLTLHLSAQSLTAHLPQCDLALHSLQQILPTLTARGVSLVAISRELPSQALSTSEKISLAFPVLSDIRNKYAAQLGILFPMPEEMRSVFDAVGVDFNERNGDESLVVPVPATILVGKDGVVRNVFVEADYSRRVEPGEVLEWVDALEE